MKPAWMRRTPMSWLYRVCTCLLWCFFKLLYRHKVVGGEHYTPGAAILAANHTSFFDPPLVGISCPEEIHYLARESLFRYRFFGWLIGLLNTHPVSGDVGDLKVFKEILGLLGRGKKVLLFPEGTRSPTGEIGELKAGIAMLAFRAGVPVTPIYVDAFRIWKRGHWPQLGGRTRCFIGKPLYPEEFAGLDRREGQEALTRALKERLLALQAQAKHSGSQSSSR